MTAAASDAWETVRRGVGRLFGRGGPKQAELARRRLEETRRQLAAVTGAELEQARAALMHRWADWLADLLEEDPDAEGELRALIGQVQPQLVSAADHSAAVGRDMSIEASGDGDGRRGDACGSRRRDGRDRDRPDELPAAAGRCSCRRTVEYHLSNAYQKLGVRSSGDLVRLALG